MLEFWGLFGTMGGGRMSGGRIMKLPLIVEEFIEFWLFFWDYITRRLYRWFVRFEAGKGLLVDTLYQRRGKYTRPFMHTGMVGIVFLGVSLGPVVLSEHQDVLATSKLPQAEVLGMSTEEIGAYGVSTRLSEGVLEYRGGEILEYEVQQGETLSTIAEQFNLDPTTIMWANGLDSERATIRAGQSLKILPVDGVMHKVRRGETVFSIATRYDSNPQAIVDYPFNTFTNDETFALAVGQNLMVPDGVMPRPSQPAPRQPSYLAQNLTPDAGQVSAIGSFVWPASGYISQGYRFYHQAIDIANRAGGPIIAADGGRVVVAGWAGNEGYGNRVVLDHGNGYRTLYAHMSSVSVVLGQSVNRGDVVGQMGCTGRCTGTHLHFEIRAGGVLQNPLNFLQ